MNKRVCFLSILSVVAAFFSYAHPQYALNDPLNDLVNPYTLEKAPVYRKYVDIIKIAVDKGENSLIFRIYLNGPIPEKPKSYLSYVLTLDSDGDPENNCGDYWVPGDTMYAVFFNAVEGGWKFTKNVWKYGWISVGTQASYNIKHRERIVEITVPLSELKVENKICFKILAEHKVSYFSGEVLVRTTVGDLTSLSCYTLPKEYTVTLDIPEGAWIEINGVKYRRGVIKLAEGTYSVTVPGIVELGRGTRLKFVKWSNGYAETTRAVKIDRNTILKPIYVKQHYLEIASECGNPTGEGWYTEGTIAKVSIEPQVTLAKDARLVFSGWTGDINSESHELEIRMDSPKSLKANWIKQYKISFTYTDAGGRIAVKPEYVILRRGTGEEIKITEPSAWLDEGNYTIVEISWQGSDVTPEGYEFEVSKPEEYEVPCSIYKVRIDLENYFNQPIRGAVVIIRFDNGTERSAKAGDIEEVYLPKGEHKIVVEYMGIKYEKDLNPQKDTTIPIRVVSETEYTAAGLIAVMMGGFGGVYFGKKRGGKSCCLCWSYRSGYMMVDYPSPLKFSSRTIAAPAGGPLPLVAAARNIDSLIITCRPCPKSGEAAVKEVPLPQNCIYKWRILEGPGYFISPAGAPHMHSNEAEGPSVIYVAPPPSAGARSWALGEAKIELVVDDGENKVEELDSKPRRRVIEITIVDPLEVEELGAKCTGFRDKVKPLTRREEPKSYADAQDRATRIFSERVEPLLDKLGRLAEETRYHLELLGIEEYEDFLSCAKEAGARVDVSEEFFKGILGDAWGYLRNQLKDRIRGLLTLRYDEWAEESPGRWKEIQSLVDSFGGLLRVYERVLRVLSKCAKLEWQRRRIEEALSKLLQEDRGRLRELESLLGSMEACYRDVFVTKECSPRVEWKPHTPIEGGIINPIKMNQKDSLRYVDERLSELNDEKNGLLYRLWELEKYRKVFDPRDVGEVEEAIDHLLEGIERIKHRVPLSDAPLLFILAYNFRELKKKLRTVSDFKGEYFSLLNRLTLYGGIKDLSYMYYDYRRKYEDYLLLRDRLKIVEEKMNTLQEIKGLIREGKTCLTSFKLKPRQLTVFKAEAEDVDALKVWCKGGGKASAILHFKDWVGYYWRVKPLESKDPGGFLMTRCGRSVAYIAPKTPCFILLECEIYDSGVQGADGSIVDRVLIEVDGEDPLEKLIKQRDRLKEIHERIVKERKAAEGIAETAESLMKRLTEECHYKKRVKTICDNVKFIASMVLTVLSLGAGGFVSALAAAASFGDLMYSKLMETMSGEAPSLVDAMGEVSAEVADSAEECFRALIEKEREFNSRLEWYKYLAEAGSEDEAEELSEKVYEAIEKADEIFKRASRGEISLIQAFNEARELLDELRIELEDPCILAELEKARYSFYTAYSSKLRELASSLEIYIDKLSKEIERTEKIYSYLEQLKLN